MNHICTCKEDNLKAGKEVYSCFICEPYIPKIETKKERAERKKDYISFVLSKAKGMDDMKLIKEAGEYYDKKNNKI